MSSPALLPHHRDRDPLQKMGQSANDLTAVRREMIDLDSHVFNLAASAPIALEGCGAR
jgi:hypothetical protein